MKTKMNKWKNAAIPALLLHCSIGTVYCWSIFSQEIADYIGDSFYLSKIAKELDNPVIVYCGVSFMGESGYLLNPDKKVLILRVKNLPDGSNFAIFQKLFATKKHNIQSR